MSESVEERLDACEEDVNDLRERVNELENVILEQRRQIDDLERDMRRALAS